MTGRAHSDHHDDMPAELGERPLERRASKLRKLDDALAVIQDGCTLAVGGLWFHNAPSAAARALLRRGVRGLELITAPPSSFTTDLLVGAGAVRRAYLPHVSFEHMGLAPNLRRAVETDALSLVECDEATLLGGLMATLEGLPEHPIMSVKGTDHLRTSPLARPWQTSDRQEVLTPPALRPDVALLHAQQADRYGNVRCLGTPFCDPVLAKASAQVIVTVDEVVDNDAIRAEPHRTTLPGYLVDAVVELPFGAHPCSSHGMYAHDESHLVDYLEKSRDAQLMSYLATWVHGISNHDQYVAAVGGTEKLHALEEQTP